MTRVNVFRKYEGKKNSYSVGFFSGNVLKGKVYLRAKKKHLLWRCYINLSLCQYQLIARYLL